MVGRAGIEPATLCLKGRYSTSELTAPVCTSDVESYGKGLMVCPKKTYIDIRRRRACQVKSLLQLRRLYSAFRGTLYGFEVYISVRVFHHGDIGKNDDAFFQHIVQNRKYLVDVFL